MTRRAYGQLHNSRQARSSQPPSMRWGDTGPIRSYSTPSSTTSLSALTSQTETLSTPKFDHLISAAQRLKGVRPDPADERNKSARVVPLEHLDFTKDKPDVDAVNGQDQLGDKELTSDRSFPTPPPHKAHPKSPTAHTRSSFLETPQQTYKRFQFALKTSNLRTAFYLYNWLTKTMPEYASQITHRDARRLLALSRTYYPTPRDHAKFVEKLYADARKYNFFPDEEMDQQDWHHLIQAWFTLKRPAYAMRLVKKMGRRGGYGPNATTYNLLLSDFAEQGNFGGVYGGLEAMEQQGVERDVTTWNIYFNVLTRDKDKSSKEIVAECLEAFEDMRESGCKPDEVTYNTVIGMLVKHSDMDSAMMLLSRMVEDGLEPTASTYLGIIGGLVHRGDVESAEAHVRAMTLASMPLNIDILENMVIGWSRKGEMDRAWLTYEEILKNDWRDHVSEKMWWALLRGAASVGRVGLLRELMEEIRLRSPSALGWNKVYDVVMRVLERRVDADVMCERFHRMFVDEGIVRGWTFEEWKRWKEEKEEMDVERAVGLFEEARKSLGSENGSSSLNQAKDQLRVLSHHAKTAITAEELTNTWTTLRSTSPRLTHDVRFWNTLLSGYTRLNAHSQTLQTHTEMQSIGIPETGVTLLFRARACVGVQDWSGAVECVERICGEEALLDGVNSIKEVFAALVKDGNVEGARKVWEVVLGTTIRERARKRKGRERVLRRGDVGEFIGLLCRCSSGNEDLVEVVKVWRQFVEDGGSLREAHVCKVVETLVRGGGKEDDAYEVLRKGCLGVLERRGGGGFGWIGCGGMLVPAGPKLGGRVIEALQAQYGLPDGRMVQGVILGLIREKEYATITQWCEFFLRKGVALSPPTLHLVFASEGRMAFSKGFVRRIGDALLAIRSGDVPPGTLSVGFDCLIRYGDVKGSLRIFERMVGEGVALKVGQLGKCLGMLSSLSLLEDVERVANVQKVVGWNTQAHGPHPECYIGLAKVYTITNNTDKLFRTLDKIRHLPTTTLTPPPADAPFPPETISIPSLYNTLILLASKHGHHSLSLKLISHIFSFGLTIPEEMITHMAEGLSAKGHVSAIHDLKVRLIASGGTPSTTLENFTVRAYVAANRTGEALAYAHSATTEWGRKRFGGGVAIDNFGWNFILRGCKGQEQVRAVLGLMKVRGCEIDLEGWVAVLRGCESLGEILGLREKVETLVGEGWEGDENWKTGLMGAFARLGEPEYCMSVCGAEEWDVDRCGSVMEAFGKVGEYAKVVEMWGRMCERGVRPLPGTFVSVLSALRGTEQVVDVEAEVGRWVGEMEWWGEGGWSMWERGRVWNWVLRVCAVGGGSGMVRRWKEVMRGRGVKLDEESFAILIRSLGGEIGEEDIRRGVGGDDAIAVVEEMEGKGVGMTERSGWAVLGALSKGGRPAMVWKWARRFLEDVEGDARVVRRVVGAWLARGNGMEAEKVVKRFEAEMEKRARAAALKAKEEEKAKKEEEKMKEGSRKTDNEDPLNLKMFDEFKNQEDVSSLSTLMDPKMYGRIANHYANIGDTKSTFRILTRLPPKDIDSVTISIGLKSFYRQPPDAEVDLRQVLALYRWARDERVPNYYPREIWEIVRRRWDEDVVRRVRNGGAEGGGGLVGESVAVLVVDAVGRWAVGKEKEGRYVLRRVWWEVLAGRELGERERLFGVNGREVREWYVAERRWGRKEIGKVEGDGGRERGWRHVRWPTCNMLNSLIEALNRVGDYKGAVKVFRMMEWKGKVRGGGIVDGGDGEGGVQTPDVPYTARPTPKTVRSLVQPLAAKREWRLLREVRAIVKERWPEMEGVVDEVVEGEIRKGKELRGDVEAEDNRVEGVEGVGGDGEKLGVADVSL
ncbi:hypothetical protein HDV00_006405 [Rhizophlyctis rosea]|nr:hypothetical protein HDV00_006405 [Rhizophlyctis rosea]